ncbi:MAG: undecaprenyl-diphosphate phosphatase [Planctomycetota bacterium]|jgi:undecaprenyl-diphosphatase
MHIWQAAILGLVEGITEYLPVSSTGHLILAAALLGLDDPERKEAVDAFTIVVQGGAILAVLGLYRRRVASMVAGLLGRDPAGRRRLFHPVPVMAALAVGGLVMILLGPWQRRYFHGDEHEPPADAHSRVDIEHLTWRRALLIGLLQCLAMWPGTSRSMATIVGGMLVGLRPRHAAEFSFLLGLPTLGGACVYRLAGNLAGDGPSMIEVLGVEALIVGLLVATVSAALAVKWLVHYLARHGVAVFGWYRLALCAVLALLMARGVVSF